MATSKNNKMTSNKVSAGVYKVTLGHGTYIVMNMNKGIKDKQRWEVFTAKNENEANCENCWACGPKSKKQAIEFIQEDFYRGLIK